MTSQSSTLGKITIARLVVVSGAIIVAANLFVAWQNNATIAEVKVGGPAFNQIAAGKDFVADILPPPLFPVEAFAVAQMINDHPALLAEKKPVIEVLRTQYAERLAYWQKEIDANGLMTAEQRQVFEKGFAEDGQKFWDEMYKTFLPAVERGDIAASEQSIQRLTEGYLAFHRLIDGTLPKVFESIANVQAQSTNDADRSKSISLYLSVLMAAFIGGLLAAAYFFIVRPIVRMTECIGQLATGNLEVAIPFAARGDELGVMARSVEVFKQNGLEAIRLREEAEEEKQRAEESQRQAEAAAIAGERQTVSESIGTGLMRLAAKDLTYRVSNMPEAYQKLQDDFNSALDQLEEAIQAVAGNTDTINSGTQEISSASDDMSRRTETQAANIEETAAAVAEITATVRKTAAGAVQAREVVAGATDEATKSSEVVRKAIEAMNGIEKSSQQINQIIGVIDELAFQTTLRALNAGVEAARAGDAGRGFAVVASEVRALAQRSAEAAKEIKALLQTSRTQVEQGVKLVAETGTSLDRIVERVAQVNTVVTEIATNAQTQAAGLQEVNTAVGQMDQTTQQNAAMAEESTAATRTLAGQSQELASVVASFTTRALRSVMPKRHEAPKAVHKPAPLAAKPAPKKAAAGGGAGDSWEEF